MKCKVCLLESKVFIEQLKLLRFDNPKDYQQEMHNDSINRQIYTELEEREGE